ncbi:HNH endonuclease signature motif containing protein [Staphylococcus pseudoxylosus]|uniref:HNH endonuclease n=1 Tax=Staphylococcus pseudoxylosus TaxID=2282419 RepID=UPI0030186825
MKDYSIHLFNQMIMFVKDVRTIPLKKCNKINCNQLIKFNESYCDEHKELKNEYKKNYDSFRYERDSMYITFYNSKEWKDARRSSMLAHDWLCQECLRKGFYTKANVVDHIVEVKDEWDKRLDQSNLEPLCHACHNVKTIREKERRLKDERV